MITRQHVSDFLKTLHPDSSEMIKAQAIAWLTSQKATSAEIDIISDDLNSYKEWEGLTSA